MSATPLETFKGHVVGLVDGSGILVMRSSLLRSLPTEMRTVSVHFDQILIRRLLVTLSGQQ